MEMIDDCCIRNACLVDHLVDWLELYGAENGYESDAAANHIPEIDFSYFITRAGGRFARVCWSYTASHLGPVTQDFSTASPIVTVRWDAATGGEAGAAAHTRAAMRAGAPVILNALLVDAELRVRCRPKMLVRTDLLPALSRRTFAARRGQEDEEAATKRRRRPTYTVVQPTFSMLHFRKGFAGLRRKASLRYTESLCALQTRALHDAELAIWPDDEGGRGGPERKDRVSVLWGRGWRCGRRRSNVAVDRFALLPAFSGEALERSYEALEWIRRLRAEGAAWRPPSRRDPEAGDSCDEDTLRMPSVPELWPNMKSRIDFPWSKAKKRIAQSCRELTLMWCIGLALREVLHENNVFAYDDPRCALVLQSVRAAAAAAAAAGGNDSDEEGDDCEESGGDDDDEKQKDEEKENDGGGGGGEEDQVPAARRPRRRVTRDLTIDEMLATNCRPLTAAELGVYVAAMGRRCPGSPRPAPPDHFGRPRWWYRPPVWPPVVECTLFEWKQTEELEIDVDLETVSNLSDTLKSFPVLEDRTMINMIGWSYRVLLCQAPSRNALPVPPPSAVPQLLEGETEERDESGAVYAYGQCQLTLDLLDPAQEREHIDSWLRQLAALRDRAVAIHAQSRGGDWAASFRPKVWCYSPAEPNFLERQFNSAAHRHGRPDWVEVVRWCDLWKVLRAEPVTIRGCLSFSLKPNYKGLQVHYPEHCPVSWPDAQVDNGLNAMTCTMHCDAVARQTRRSMQEMQPMKDQKAYNRVDVAAMYWFRRYLRRFHSGLSAVAAAN